MKKLSIAAICAATLASVCIAAPTFAAEAATVRVYDNAFFNALRNYAHFTTTPANNVVSFVDKGGSTPSSGGSPIEYNALIHGGTLTGIEFDCSRGNPLAYVTDFSDLANFTSLQSIVLCDEIDYDFSDDIDVFIVNKHAPQGELALSDDLADVFYDADYEFWNVGANTQPVGSHADTPVIIATSSENVRTITFDCFGGDPLANATREQLTNIFAMFPNAETFYVCSNAYEAMVPDNAHVVVQDVIDAIPAGDYTMDEDDYEKNGLGAKLIDKDGNATEYTYRDLRNFLLAISDNPKFEANLKGVIDENSDSTHVSVSVKYKGEDYLTLTYGDEDTASDEAKKSDETENPDTADDFTGIIAAIALSGVALGAGAFAATRRR